MARIAITLRVDITKWPYPGCAFRHPKKGLVLIEHGQFGLLQSAHFEWRTIDGKGRVNPKFRRGIWRAFDLGLQLPIPGTAPPKKRPV